MSLYRHRIKEHVEQHDAGVDAFCSDVSDEAIPHGSTISGPSLN